MERFWAKVLKTDEGCWIWIAGKSTKGYGKFNLGGRTVSAHRLSYEWARGPIPEGRELDHLCRNRACVKPDHLEPVAHHENVLRGNLGKATATHCGYGHPYTSENTYVRKDGKGKDCRQCKLRRQLKHQKARKEADVRHPYH